MLLMRCAVQMLDEVFGNPVLTRNGEAILEKMAGDSRVNINIYGVECVAVDINPRTNTRLDVCWCYYLAPLHVAR